MMTQNGKSLKQFTSNSLMTIKKSNIIKLLLLVSLILVLILFLQIESKSFPKTIYKTLENEEKLTALSDENQKILDSVFGLQEVKDLKKLIDENGRSTLGLFLNEYPTADNPNYTIQVYEEFPDHTATFNWYRVSTNGEISRQDFSQFDKWDIIHQDPTKGE